MDSNLVLLAVCVVAMAAIVTLAMSLRRTLRSLDNDRETMADLLSAAVSQNLMMKSGESELDRLRMKARGESAMRSFGPEPGVDRELDPDQALSTVGLPDFIEKPTRPGA